MAMVSIEFIPKNHSINPIIPSFSTGAKVHTQLLLGGQDSLILKKSYPRPHEIVEKDKILEKYKLSYRR